MQGSQKDEILDSMIQFIKKHGEERVLEIQEQSKTNFAVEKEKQIEAEKKRLFEMHNKNLKVAEVNLKIERSAEANKARIAKMRTTNEMVESLLTDSKKAMAEHLQNDQDSYAELLKNLLVQGLIKLIEPKVTLRVRESDKDIVAGVIDGAVSEYKQMMLEQVEALKGKDDIPCDVTIDEANFLPEWNPDDMNNSCMGGFKMFCKKNRIVCSQTLDDRMELVYAQAIPAIRATLFPSLTRPKGNAGQ